MNGSIRLLHLEDDPRDAELIRQKLKTSEIAIDIFWANSKETFESALDREVFDLVLTDYNLPGYGGLSALRHVRKRHADLPVIIISGTLGEDSAVECLKAGATDYVLKQRPQRLLVAITRALAEKAEQEKRRAAQNALHESEERFRSAMHLSAVGMALVAPDGRWLEVNRALSRITGYSEQELLALDYQSITHPDDLAIDLAHVRRMLSREIDSYQLEKRYIHKDGSIVWILLGVSLLWNPDGSPRHFISQIQDITQRKRSEARIEKLSRMHALLSGTNALIVRVRNRQQLFEEACRLAVEQGRFAFAWIGSPGPAGSVSTPLAWAGPGDGYLAEVGNALKGMTEDPGAGGRALREKRVIVANDIERDQEVMFKEPALSRGFRSLAVLPLVIAEKSVGIFVLYATVPDFFDVEEIKLLTELAGDISFALDHAEKEARLDYLAYYDALTGLPNRALFLDRCNQMLRAVAPKEASIALVLIDIERFRNINETLGRHAGDALLKRLAARLGGLFRGTIDVARIGADNFALIVPGIRHDTDAARLFEDEVVPAVGGPIEFDGNEYRLSAKAGIAIGPVNGANAETLLQNAESALSSAKQSGQRRRFYAPDMNARIGERLFLESKLRVALEKNQFVLYYQPKFDAHTREITGLEALIRWADPATGIVPPAQFIPLLEETGLILEVGNWAMNQALADLRKWRHAGVSTRIAVNVSAIQLRQDNFAETVREIVARHSGSDQEESCGLDLEITESVVMEDIQSSVVKLGTIRDMGIRIYVDDFGTGYSSLSYIARLPIHALKIDRAFVDCMTTSAEDRTIVSIIVLLAHSLNLTVVAEGVETEEQFTMLKILKCDEIQGYLLGRPVTADEIGARLAHSSNR